MRTGTAAHLLELELRERLPAQVGSATLRRPSGNGDSQAAWDVMTHQHAKLPGLNLVKIRRSRLALTAPTVPMGDSSVMPLLVQGRLARQAITQLPDNVAVPFSTLTHRAQPCQPAAPSARKRCPPSLPPSAQLTRPGAPPRRAGPQRSRSTACRELGGTWPRSLTVCKLHAVAPALCSCLQAQKKAGSPSVVRKCRLPTSAQWRLQAYLGQAAPPTTSSRRLLSFRRCCSMWSTSPRHTVGKNTCDTLPQALQLSAASITCGVSDMLLLQQLVHAGAIQEGPCKSKQHACPGAGQGVAHSMPVPAHRLLHSCRCLQAVTLTHPAAPGGPQPWAQQMRGPSCWPARRAGGRRRVPRLTSKTASCGFHSPHSMAAEGCGAPSTAAACPEAVLPWSMGTAASTRLLGCRIGVHQRNTLPPLHAPNFDFQTPLPVPLT